MRDGCARRDAARDAVRSWCHCAFTDGGWSTPTGGALLGMGSLQSCGRRVVLGPPPLVALGRLTAMLLPSAPTATATAAFEVCEWFGMICGDWRSQQFP